MFYTTRKTTKKRDKCISRKQAENTALLAEIEQLKAKVAELEKDREWLPIDENTPKDQEIMLSNETYVFIGEWCIDGWIDSASQFELDHVTHWKPLPKTHLELKGGAA